MCLVSCKITEVKKHHYLLVHIKHVRGPFGPAADNASECPQV